MNTQLIQICMDYSSLPNFSGITVEDVRFFYRPLIDGLIEMQNMKRQ